MLVAGVLPPDEDAGVRNNSVYTNTIARLAFVAYGHALKLLGTPNPKWAAYAQHMHIPLDTELQYHPEYDGYVKGGCVF